jgi:hypothetical protein
MFIFWPTRETIDWTYMMWFVFSSLFYNLQASWAKLCHDALDLIITWHNSYYLISYILCIFRCGVWWSCDGHGHEWCWRCDWAASSTPSAWAWLGCFPTAWRLGEEGADAVLWSIVSDSWVPLGRMERRWWWVTERTRRLTGMGRTGEDRRNLATWARLACLTRL